MEFWRIEITKANLDPSRWIGTGTDAKTVTIPNVTHDAAE